MGEKYSFSKHAKERIKSRGILDSTVMNVIKNPDSVIDESSCKSIYQKVFTEGKKKFMIRVFINSCKEPNLVITAYKTTKIDKYEY